MAREARWYKEETQAHCVCEKKEEVLWRYCEKPLPGMHSEEKHGRFAECLHFINMHGHNFFH